MDALESEDSLDSHAFMELAMQELKFALQRLEVPVGCVIVKKGKVIASGSNLTNETRNARRHAEMEAVDGLLQLWQEDGLLQFDAIIRLSECVLCVTCEPCMMCAAALSFLGWKEVYYGCVNDKFGGCGLILSLHSTSSERCIISRSKGFKCVGGIMASEVVSLFQTFYERGNPNAEASSSSTSTLKLSSHLRCCLHRRNWLFCFSTNIVSSKLFFIGSFRRLLRFSRNLSG